MRPKMSRRLMRIMAGLAVLTLGLLLTLSALNATTDIDLEALLALQDTNLLIGAFTTLLGLTGPTSMMVLWVCMLYHWGTHRFRTPGHKKGWLALLLLGNVALAPIYYLAVSEGRCTLADDEAP